jgi:Zinc carboxypeptidase
MPPPTRTTAANYHFYVYDYAASAPYTLSPPVAGRQNMQFYSMVQDMNGLLATGQANNVPHIALRRIGVQIPDQTGTLRDIKVLSFGGGGNPAADPGILLTGGIHAREWVAPAIAYLIAEYLIMNYSTSPVGAYQTALQNLVDSRRIYFIPLLNPNGNFYTVYDTTQDARMWRKNRRLLPGNAAGWVNSLTNRGAANPPFANVQNLNPAQNIIRYDLPVYGSAPVTFQTVDIDPTADTTGVDLNRNYDTPSWGYSTGDATDNNGQPPAIDYCGPDRASEDETQNVQTWMTQVQALTGTAFETSVDYHSYSQFILYPTEAYDTGLVNQNYTNLGLIMQRLIATGLKWSFTYNYSLGTPIALVKYDAVGTLADHAATRHNARAFVIELDPSSKAPYPGGFALPENQIMGVFEKNIRAALALIAAAGQASGATAGNIFARHTVTSAAEAQFLTWDVFGRGNRLPV